MPAPILTTKLYIPPPRPKMVLRPRLIEKLNEGFQRKLTLISAPAGFGKTTLVSEWIAACGRAGAWLSLDEGDNDLKRFMTYLVAALQTIEPDIGKEVPVLLQSPQPVSMETLLTPLVNEIAAIGENFLLVLDDYHIIDAKPVAGALTFLVENLPPQMHLVIATREDPPLPLARLRVRGSLTELRAADLRFTPAEASGFLNRVMGLNLSEENIAALETRTEGWIAGLQLAAISMQGHKDTAGFIKSFTGSHHFVMDYLVEEVLLRQSEKIRTFLLGTSILERMCGPLCDALLPGQGAGQEILEYLEHANLFIIPLDNERRWYRYHHLFADLLRQRLQQNCASSAKDVDAVELHIRASQWYEDNSLEVEAFQHAAAADDLERAERLIEGKGMPLHFRGAVTPVLNWLESLPEAVLNSRPSLRVIYASALIFIGQLTGVEQKLQAAEAVLQESVSDHKTRDLIGHIAAIRATLAVSQNQIENIIVQSRRALEYLHPENLPVRTATTWTLGYAYHLQGKRAAASRAYTEAISISRAIGHIIINLSATIGLGSIQEQENQLHLAARTYRQVLEQAGDVPFPVVCEAHLGLARIFYQWNDLDTALEHWKQNEPLARQLENMDRHIAGQVFLARLKLAMEDTAGAAEILAEAGESARRHNFVLQIPQIAAAKVRALLHQGNTAAAFDLVQNNELPMSRARVYLAQGDSSAALAVLEPLLLQVEAKDLPDERLKIMVLQAVALGAHGEKEKAARRLGEALTLAEPEGFIRIFVDEGMAMAGLLERIKDQGGKRSAYIQKLIDAFGKKENVHSSSGETEPLVEPLSLRELEVLRLIAGGLSNREISERLFLALSTVKGHNLRIFGKLQVQRRTEAVARARQLGLL